MQTLRTYLLLLSLVFFPMMVLPQLPVTDTLHQHQPLRTSHIKHFMPNGQVSTGYFYGLLPYVVADSTAVSSYLQSEGNIKAAIWKIPFDISFFHTTLKNISGLNNYFRASFDVQRYREGVLREVSEKKAVVDRKLDSLQRMRQKTGQAQLYNEYLLTGGWKGYVLQRTEKYRTQVPSALPSVHAGVPDTLLMKIPDSSAIPSLPLVDTSSLHNHLNYSSAIDTARLRDSISNAYLQHTQQLNQINNEIELLKKKKQQYDVLLNSGRDSLHTLLPAQRFLQSVKRLDIGLCYPDFSPLLANGIVLKGVHAEFMFDKIYVGVAGGKTLNNLLFTSNVVTNRLNNTRNLFNYFDFSNVMAGRNLLVIKAGPGDKNKTHFHIGVLLGKGLASYMVDSNEVLYSSTKEINQVFEADARINISHHHMVNVIYAKSFTTDVPNTTTETTGNNQEWFNPSYFSHAALGKYEGNFPRLKSKLTVQARWIDAYFKSYGVAFARPDNLRYEVKTDHQLHKTLKLSLLFRNEGNNIRNLYSYHIHVYSAGAAVNYKPVKAWQFKLQYRPVIMKTEMEGIILKRQNKIMTGVVTWSPRMAKQRALFSSVYNYFHLSDSTSGMVYESFSFSGLIPIYKQWRVGLLTSYYGSKNTHGISNYTYDTLSKSLINSAEINFTGKKNFIITAGFKIGWTEYYGWQPGWLVSAQVGLPVKGLLLETRAEQLLYGDFYNSFGLENFQKFPYTCQARVVFSW